ncbi:MAG: phosphate ABC transporter permease PstA [bacterium]
MGSLWLLVIAVGAALPLGVASAIYLEEYAPRNRLTELLEINIYNLAGVPAIVYGILGLGIFVRFLGLGRSILAGGFTLGALLLPIIIISSREAIRAIPNTFREASYALGATHWQTIYSVVLPPALPGIITGAIVGISRIVGEAAPLIVVGGAAFVSFLPKSPLDEFTALPLQIYTWVSYPKKGFQVNAAAGILILIGFTILFNLAITILRYRLRKKMKW